MWLYARLSLFSAGGASMRGEAVTFVITIVCFAYMLIFVGAVECRCPVRIVLLTEIRRGNVCNVKLLVHNVLRACALLCVMAGALFAVKKAGTDGKRCLVGRLNAASAVAVDRVSHCKRRSFAPRFAV